MYKRTGIKGSNVLDVIDKAYEDYSLQQVSRVWAMPSIWTFTVKPISELISKYQILSYAFRNETSKKIFRCKVWLW